MSDESNVNYRERSAGLPEDDVLAALFRQAEPRPIPTPSQEATIRRAVYLEWKATVKQRTKRTRRLWAVAASAVISAVIIGTLVQNAPEIALGPEVAAVDKHFGVVEFSPKTVNAVSDHMLRVSAGQSIATGDHSGVALAWVNGGSLRLDQNTSVRIDSAQEIFLQSGRVYFDSRPATHSTQMAMSDLTLVINTPAGTVTPLGTRYQTQVVNDELIVTVREGRVVVESDRVREHAVAREQLIVASNGVATRSVVDTFGNSWHWVEATSPFFDSAGKNVYDFLNWVGRESGREIRFRTAETERIARNTAIVGFGLLDASPTDALDIVMPTTGLHWSIQAGEIHVYP